MQIDLGASDLAEHPFGFQQNLPRQTAPAEFRGDRHIIQPAAMAFVSRHGRGDHYFILCTDEEQIRPDALLSLNVLVRIVFRSDQITSPPQVDDGRFIGGLKRSHQHVRLTSAFPEEMCIPALR